MAVRHHLESSRARIGQTEVVNDIVQSGLQDLQHRLAGDTPPFEGAFINAAKLALEQPVIIAQLLFFN